MAAAGNRVDHSSSMQELNQKTEESSSQCYLIPVAISVILMLAGIAASGLLYSRLGYASLSFGGGGLAAGIVLLLVAKYGCQSDEGVIEPPKPPTQNREEELIQAFEETKSAYLVDRGYTSPSGRKVTLDNGPMIRGKVVYGDRVDPLVERNRPIPTAFTVVTDDILNVLVRESWEGKNPVGLNMANGEKPGGGVLKGATGPEETICRRTNLYVALANEGQYPLQTFGGIYTPHVQVFRDKDYRFMEQPFDVALISVAAYDLRPECFMDRPEAATYFAGSQGYVIGTKLKISNMLRMAAAQGHTTLVLGALGCGELRNDPVIMAEIFRQVFEEDEFRGQFVKVIFAITTTDGFDQKTIDVFAAKCGELNQMRSK